MVRSITLPRGQLLHCVADDATVTNEFEKNILSVHLYSDGNIAHKCPTSVESIVDNVMITQRDNCAVHDIQILYLIVP